MYPAAANPEKRVKLYGVQNASPWKSLYNSRACDKQAETYNKPKIFDHDSRNSSTYKQSESTTNNIRSIFQKHDAGAHTQLQ